DSSDCAISPNGRYVAFISEASDLVPGDSNGQRDVFVHDCQTGETFAASVNSQGEIGNGESGTVSHAINVTDTPCIVFESHADNLVPGDGNFWADVFVHHLPSRTTVRASVGSASQEADGLSLSASISPDGHLVAFASAADNLVSGDLNGYRDIFVR